VREIEVRTRSEAETVVLGDAVARLLDPGTVVSLSGDLGAGKTRFVRGMAQGMGITDPVTSPTFNIHVAHRGPVTLNHFDLYRLDDESQLEDIDLWGVLESGGVSAIEWGDRFSGVLPDDRLDVSIEFDDDSRLVTIRATGPTSMRVLDALGDAGDFTTQEG